MMEAKSCSSKYFRLFSKEKANCEQHGYGRRTDVLTLNNKLLNGATVFKAIQLRLRPNLLSSLRQTSHDAPV